MTKVLRFAALLCLPTFLCTCGPAQIKSTEPTVVIGNIRYEESPKLLETSLTVSPFTTTPPAVLGQNLSTVSGMGKTLYRNRQKIEFPAAIDLSIPDHPGLVIRFSPPFADSIPAVLSKRQSVKIPTMKTGLASNENLILFLEPKDRSVPKRILLEGPTKDGILTLPKLTISDVKPGKYRAYLIKQQLQKDSTASLQSSLQTEYYTKSIPIEVKE